MGAYRSAALAYFEAGWSPIPIRVDANGKRPCVKGFSGHDGAYPDRKQVLRWTREFDGASVGLRVPHDVVGVDVDRYDGRAGAFTIGCLSRRHGLLSATWVSTSRTDGSGIQMFRLPPGVDPAAFRDPRTPDRKPGGVEIIKYCHRFVTVAPTRHGREGHPEYRWYTPDGYPSPDEFPGPEDLAVLPAQWCVALAAGRSGGRAKGRPPGNITEWLAARPGGTGEPCQGMARVLDGALAAVRTGGTYGGAHTEMLIGVHQLVGNSTEGCRGVLTAVQRVGAAYIKAVANRRDGRTATAEVVGAVQGEIAARVTQPMSDEDPCAGACTWKATAA